MTNRPTKWELDIAFIRDRARRYAEGNVTRCGECGGDPGPPPDVFSELLPCGHARSCLVYVPKEET